MSTAGAATIVTPAPTTAPTASNTQAERQMKAAAVYCTSTSDIYTFCENQDKTIAKPFGFKLR